MPRYRITSPDGRVFDITTPDEAQQPQGGLPPSIAGIGQDFGSDRTAVESAFGNSAPVNPLTSAAAAALIGSGRTLDKIAEGNRQIGNSAMVIGKDAIGMDPKADLQALASQAKDQANNDAIYGNLRAKFPFSTGVGEALPAVAIPVGQETALGRILAPAAGLGAMEAMQYGTPAHRAIEGAKGLALGAVGGSVGEIANAAIAPAASRLSGAQQNAVRSAADKVGVVPLPSQLTGNPNLARVEDFLARVQGGAGVMKDFVGDNQRAINRTAAGAMGQNTDEVTTDVFAAAKKQQGAERDALRQGASMPVTQPVFNAIGTSEKMLTSGLKSDGKSAALNLLSELKDKLYNTKALTGEELQAIGTDLKTAARSTDNMTISAALRHVQKALDDASTINKNALAQSNAQIAARKTLQSPNVVNEVTGDVAPGKLASVMQNDLGEAMKTGTVNGPLVDLYNYAKAMPAMRAGSPTFERSAVGNLRDWILSPAYWASAKAMTSQAGRDYLSGGILGNPAISGPVGQIARRAALPLAASPAQQAMWQMGILGYQ